MERITVFFNKWSKNFHTVITIRFFLINFAGLNVVMVNFSTINVARIYFLLIIYFNIKINKKQFLSFRFQVTILIIGD
jgi:hypothetical protein